MELKSAFQDLATNERFIQDSRDIIKTTFFINLPIAFLR